jgi:membrane-associated phospholipid phosphatase
MLYFGTFLFVMAALLLATVLGRRWRWLGGIPPRGYLGLHLALGVLILFGASWLFGGIAENVMAGDPLTATDRNVVQWFNDHRTPGLTTVLLVATAFASPLWVTCATLATGLVLWRKRYWYRLLALGLVVPGGVSLIPLLKMAFHRHRPSAEDALADFQGYSFPSGHTMTATLLYGLLAVLSVLALKGWQRQTKAVLAAFAMVLLVGFSRVYLGAHYLSDVLGAIAAGIAWLALSLTAVDTLRQSRSHPIQRLETP